MAAAMFSEGRSREEFVNEFLTCSICAEPYDNGSHQAKCLPCLHTYCKACLQKVVGKRTELDCPNCRKLVKLPGGTVESLPNNFVVENLREYQNIFNLSVACGNCDEGNPAVRYCQDCDAFQCQDCTDNHEKMRSTRMHQLLTLEELKAQKRNPLMHRARYCIKHPKQELTLYCKNEDCKLPVCAACSLVDHKSHDLVYLDAAIDEVKAKLRQSTAAVNNKYRDTCKRQAEVETLKESVDSEFDQKERYLQELEEKLMSSIRKQCDGARQQLKNVCDDEIGLMDARIESLRHLASQLSSACEFADQSCDIGSMQLLTLQQQITDRLNELERTEVPEPVLKTNFEFTTEHHSAMAQIQELLVRLNDIKAKPQIDPKECTIRFGLESERSDAKGNWKKAVIQAVDSNKDVMVTGGAKIVATQDEEPPYEVEDNNDGTYSFEYNRSSEVHVKISDIKMTGSPFNLQQLDPMKCVVLFHEGKATIQTADCDGQNITTGGAAIEVTENDTVCEVEDKNDGTYAFDYEHVDGRLVCVKVNGQQTIGSPFTIEPIKAETDPQHCTIQFVARTGKATIQMVDVNGQMITTGGNKVEVRCGGVPRDVQDNKDGTYQFNYYALQNSLHVKINSVPLKGSPFNVSVDPHKCTVEMGQECGDNTKRKAVVQCIDTNGEKLTRGNTLVEVSQNKQSLYVEDNDDGTYTFYYMCHSTSVVKNNGDVCHAPSLVCVRINEVEINLDSVDPTQCTVNLGLECKKDTKSQSKQKTVVQSERRAIIRSKDYSGTDLKSGGCKVEATQEGEPLEVQDNQDGTYAVTYKHVPRSPALFHVKVNGIEIKGSPFIDSLDPSKCTVKLGLESEGSMKRKAIVQSINYRETDIKFGGYMLEATQEGKPMEVQDNQDGTYAVIYTYYTHARYNQFNHRIDAPEHFHVKFNGTNVKGSPFQWHIAPSRCTLKQRYIHNEYYNFLQTFDVNGQEIKYGGETVNASQCERSSLQVEDQGDGTYKIEHYRSVSESNPLVVSMCGTSRRFTSLSKV